MSGPNPVQSTCRVATKTPVRLAFVSLFEPRKRSKSGTPDKDGKVKVSYQATLLIPPGHPQLAEFAGVVKTAMLNKFNKILPLKDRGLPIKRAETCVNTQSGEAYNGFAPGWISIATNSWPARPAVVGRDRLAITDPSVVYAGCWCNVVVDAFAWDHPDGGKGVSFDLKAVQFVDHGKDTDPDGARLDGRGKPVNTDDAFEALEMPAEGDASGGEAPWDPLA